MAWTHLERLITSRFPGVVTLVESVALQLGNFSALPTADTPRRGALARVEGASGVLDILYWERKTTADTLEWVPVVVGTPTLLHVTYLMHEDPTSANANFIWTNMPAAVTPLYGGAGTTYVRRIDLTAATEARLSFHVAVAGVAGAKLFLRYATDGSTFTTPSTGIQATFGASTGQFTSGWVALESGMQADVWVAVYGSGGDGVADPRFTTVSAEFR